MIIELRTGRYVRRWCSVCGQEPPRHVPNLNEWLLQHAVFARHAVRRNVIELVVEWFPTLSVTVEAGGVRQ